MRAPEVPRYVSFFHPFSYLSSISHLAWAHLAHSVGRLHIPIPKYHLCPISPSALSDSTSSPQKLTSPTSQTPPLRALEAVTSNATSVYAASSSSTRPRAGEWRRCTIRLLGEEVEREEKGEEELGTGKGGGNRSRVGLSRRGGARSSVCALRTSVTAGRARPHLLAGTKSLPSGDEARIEYARSLPVPARFWRLRLHDAVSIFGPQECAGRAVRLPSRGVRFRKRARLTLDLDGHCGLSEEWAGCTFSPRTPVDFVGVALLVRGVDRIPGICTWQLQVAC
ncbi:hypothetical protein C8J57DRAFT_1523286 [Mycena rebaudengoi]|nr:hypothetical protein C8J57DRAFT_1523286 [Mycena rebaudengoi]